MLLPSSSFLPTSPDYDDDVDDDDEDYGYSDEEEEYFSC